MKIVKYRKVEIEITLLCNPVIYTRARARVYNEEKEH